MFEGFKLIPTDKKGAEKKYSILDGLMIENIRNFKIYILKLIFRF